MPIAVVLVAQDEISMLKGAFWFIVLVGGNVALAVSVATVQFRSYLRRILDDHLFMNVNVDAA